MTHLSRPMSEREYTAIVNRQRRLPEQLDAARRKVRALENEARRLGLAHLLEGSTCHGEAGPR